MIMLVGHGYIGSAFQKEIRARGIDLVNASHEDVSTFWNAHELLKKYRPSLVINAAAFIPTPSVQLCDIHPEETIDGNVLLPTVLCNACQDQGIPFAHISTGCLWSDGKVHSEDDIIQRSFNGHCGFYIGTKVQAEKVVSAYPKAYIWRVRLPFDENDEPRNYLRKIIDFKQVWRQKNSACHRGDFVKACLDLVECNAPFGIYNVNNTGTLDVKHILERMLQEGLIVADHELVEKSDGQCSLCNDKLLNAGVAIRHVEDAFEDSLRNWSTRYVPPPYSLQSVQ